MYNEKSISDSLFLRIEGSILMSQLSAEKKLLPSMEQEPHHWKELNYQPLHCGTEWGSGNEKSKNMKDWAHGGPLSIIRLTFKFREEWELHQSITCLGDLVQTSHTHGCCGCNANKGRVKRGRINWEEKKYEKEVMKCTEHYQSWMTVRDEQTFVQCDR